MSPPSVLPGYGFTAPQRQAWTRGGILAETPAPGKRRGSLLPQGDQRVEPRGAAHRDEAGAERDGREKRRDGEQGRRIALGHPVQEGPDGAQERDGAEAAGGDSGEGHARLLSQDQPGDLRRQRAER